MKAKENISVGQDGQRSFVAAIFADRKHISREATRQGGEF